MRRESVDPKFARPKRQQPGQCTEQRRLAGAVRANHAERLAHAKIERHALEHTPAAIVHRQIARRHRERDHCAASSGSAARRTHAQAIAIDPTATSSAGATTTVSLIVKCLPTAAVGYTKNPQDATSVSCRSE